MFCMFSSVCRHYRIFMFRKRTFSVSFWRFGYKKIPKFQKIENIFRYSCSKDVLYIIELSSLLTYFTSVFSKLSLLLILSAYLIKKPESVSDLRVHSSWQLSATWLSNACLSGRLWPRISAQRCWHFVQLKAIYLRIYRKLLLGFEILADCQ